MSLAVSVAGSSILVVLTLVKRINLLTQVVYDKNTSFGNNNYRKGFFVFFENFNESFHSPHRKTIFVTSVSRKFKKKVSLSVQDI